MRRNAIMVIVIAINYPEHRDLSGINTINVSTGLHASLLTPSISLTAHQILLEEYDLESVKGIRSIKEVPTSNT